MSSLRVIVTVSVEAENPERAAAALTPLLADLGAPVAERWEPVAYDRTPGTWMASAVLDEVTGDARSAAARLTERVRLGGWQVDGDAGDAEAVWNREADAQEGSPYPGITWALIEVDLPEGTRGPDADPVVDNVFADHSLEGEAFLWTLAITMDEQWWSTTATAVVAVKVAADDAVRARELARDAVEPLDVAVHEEPSRLESGEWRVVFKAFASADAGGPDDSHGPHGPPGPVGTARRFADLLQRPSGWTTGGRDCGYAVWGRGDVVAEPVREIFIAVP